MATTQLGLYGGPAQPYGGVVIPPPDPVPATGVARITYNSKTVDLTGDQGSGLIYELYVDPSIMRTINTSLTGDVETIFLPRMDVRVLARFRPCTDAALRMQLQGWWQWAQRGNQFRFAVNSLKTVVTSLVQIESAGDDTIAVSANASSADILPGQNYVLISGPYYQLVTVVSVSDPPYLLGAALARDVVLTEALDYTFPLGTRFRDEFLWDAKLRDPEMRSPIRDLFDPAVLGTWEFDMEFVEDVG